ncbi:hypothetical protein FIBSPDRAFT_897232 [Athelia psychrophila]|uniref:Uncharacterized protein n=1 Tax=Athelia psychrophila TaxID=1759441 RepID=A0A166CIC2_9AGAM|nr:hypothetical protein FIBSPDRAFT_897232 [Fibularhizoctonia sp. CBS 109695]
MDAPLTIGMGSGRLAPIVLCAIRRRQRLQRCGGSGIADWGTGKYSGLGPCNISCSPRPPLHPTLHTTAPPTHPPAPVRFKNVQGGNQVDPAHTHRSIDNTPRLSGAYAVFSHNALGASSQFAPAAPTFSPAPAPARLPPRLPPAPSLQIHPNSPPAAPCDVYTLWIRIRASNSARGRRIFGCRGGGGNAQAAGQQINIESGFPIGPGRPPRTAQVPLIHHTGEALIKDLRPPLSQGQPYKVLPQLAPLGSQFYRPLPASKTIRLPI